MSTNILPLNHSATPAVGSALNAFFGAASQLGSALVATLFKTSQVRPLSASDEAEQVRMMAESYVATDPGFAQDLFAAADRHEALHSA
jgi:hypothetical protein